MKTKSAVHFVVMGCYEYESGTQALGVYATRAEAEAFEAYMDADLFDIRNSDTAYDENKAEYLQRWDYYEIQEVRNMGDCNPIRKQI
jgi:hypothetical protein